MQRNNKFFEKYFKAFSYTVVLCGLFSLLIAGGVECWIAVIFIAAILVAWFLEDTNWQLSERFGVIIILLALPFFYIDWKYQLNSLNSGENMMFGNLACLILLLGANNCLHDSEFNGIHNILWVRHLAGSSLG